MPVSIHNKRSFEIPEGVTVTVKARVVNVKGPRGELTTDFKHIQADVYVADNEFTVELWNGKGKQLAVVRSIVSHTQNMITGVTKGFRYKMRFVYSHFPINLNITKEQIELRNYLGEKRVRIIKFPAGITCVRDPGVKDQIVLEGNSLPDVGRVSALIHQACLARKKDIRKFLDGVYVTEKGNIEE
ncbi:60S ribosomal protein L9 [Pycnococcus provasolii]|nr:60S ribosomal protein L9 [Pycnococcus provasolii]